MTGWLQHPSVDSDHWSVKPADLAQVAAPAHIHPAGPGKGRIAKSTKRITHRYGASYPHSVSASEILAGMATRRKPKNPGGRPAVWGPRHTMSIRPPEALYSKLEDAAEAAGLTVAEYCVVELAASHDFELPNTNSDQLPLAIGA